MTFQPQDHLCQIGEARPVGSFAPPNDQQGRPNLDVWTFRGGQHVSQCEVFHFHRTGHDAPWIRIE